ncbi:MAG TPA: hypothetical protein PLD20_30955 [Blastocatellia bacterium]|nr:hypothetical protein [Blastocatellia bacterium]HMV86813.1 hypothetical protein [Blastocatellia bacterium]HMX24698.1 hypothetical protein [Blastocatellia bacterium]HMZ22391.1 hypothetical protein [Blastocatellia bacterium]HNG34666.1 hypothetical protein [Blastocatellia bacterium]
MTALQTPRPSETGMAGNQTISAFSRQRQSKVVKARDFSGSLSRELEGNGKAQNAEKQEQPISKMR